MKKRMEKDSLKEIRRIVMIVAVVVILIVYSGSIVGAIEGFFDVFNPFLAGTAIAFVLNLPMSALEKRLFKKWQGETAAKMKRIISMFVSILLVLAVLAVVIFSVAPQVTATAKDIGHRIPEFNSQLIEYAKEWTAGYPKAHAIVEDWEAGDLDFSGIADKLTSFLQSGAAGSIVSSTVNVASSIASFVIRTIVAICFAVYLLLTKEKVLRNIKIVCKTYMPKKTFRYLHHALNVLTGSFRRFIAGQCLEAVILGLIFAVFMTIFRIPYTTLISVLIAFTALIPVVGAFIGCAVGAFLILIVSPVKMIEFLILFIVLQQIENKLIYPRIVGSSVGLPAIWVFVAVTVGGSLFGVMGMLVFIPIVSTLYTLLKEDIRRRNKKQSPKKVKTDTTAS